MFIGERNLGWREKTGRRQVELAKDNGIAFGKEEIERRQEDQKEQDFGMGESKEQNMNNVRG